MRKICKLDELFFTTKDKKTTLRWVRVREMISQNRLQNVFLESDGLFEGLHVPTSIRAAPFLFFYFPGSSCGKEKEPRFLLML